MPKIISFVFIAFSFFTTSAQVALPSHEYSYKKYNEKLKDTLTHYKYSLWDFDGDSKTDTIYFISNGGVHTYYHFELYSTSKSYKYKEIILDMPYYSKDTIAGLTFFHVADFNKDGILDIYLNFANPFGRLTKRLKRKKIKNREVLIYFEKRKIRLTAALKQ